MRIKYPMLTSDLYAILCHLGPWLENTLQAFVDFLLLREGLQAGRALILLSVPIPKLTREKESSSDYSLQEDLPCKKLSFLSGQ